MPVTAPPLDSAALSHLDDDAAAGRPLGVAVSGGSDSTALLLILAGRYGAGALRVATVDHGLRPEAAAEAEAVAALCRARGIAHQTLRWQGWDGKGNLQDQARRARYRLLAGWAAGAGVASVALGHTGDDNAETFLLGLSRGAGLDGLSGMRVVFDRGGIRFTRPLLAARRDALRAYLTDQGVPWIDDPSNDDPRFDRIKARQALAQLAPLGIDAAGLARTIANLRSTRAAIGAALAEWARTHVTQDRGDLLIAPDAFLALPDDFARRLVNAALRWISRADYPPRADSVMDIVGKGAESGAVTLHGCLISFKAPAIRIGREPEAAARAPAVAPAALWDGRWRLTGPDALGAELRALGEQGLADCPGWRDTGLPRASLLAAPALWRDNTLVAAPLAGLENGWRAELAQGAADFHQSLISH